MLSVCRRFQLNPCSKFYFHLDKSSGVWSISVPSGGGNSPIVAMTMSSASSVDLSTWSNVFSEENKRRTIEVLATDRDNSSFSTSGEIRAAAVLVPFCYDVKGRPGLLCNLRSENLSSHKGEISFPGGTFEEQDNNDPVVAALRETEEELGITRDSVDVWTTCRPFPTVSTKMGVVPVVGFITSGRVNPELLQINPDEVDHAFIIPLEHLCNPDNWAEMTPPSRLGGSTFTLPTYQNMHEISDKLLGTHLWGLTAFISHLVLTALIPKQYTRKVEYISLMRRRRKSSSGTGEALPDVSDNDSNKDNNTSEANSPNSKL